MLNQVNKLCASNHRNRLCGQHFSSFVIQSCLSGPSVVAYHALNVGTNYGELVI
jgi:hypothetical protein